MAVDIRLYNINSIHEFKVEYTLSGYTNPYTLVGNYSSGTTTITISGVNYNSIYFVKMTDNVTGQYIIQPISTTDPECYSCFTGLSLSCYEINTTGGGNYVVDYVDFTDTSVSVSLNNEIYYVCAIPDSLTYLGSGPITVTPQNVPCSYTPDCWEEFTMEVGNLSTLTISQIESSGKYAIEWEPGVFTYHSSGTASRSYTYSSSFTGFVKIKAPSLTYIKRLQIVEFVFSAAPGRYLNVQGPEIAKLTNLELLNIGFGRETRLFCDTSQLSPTIRNLNVYKGNVTGDISNLPSSLTFLGLYATTVSGDTQNLPSGLTTCIISGSNTISGDTSNLPPSFTNNLVRLEIYGQNQITGNIDTFGLYTSIQTLIIHGNNTINGDLSNISTATSFRVLSILGRNSISGNLSGLTSLTRLTFFRVDNNDDVLNFGSVGNTITGDLSSLPPTITNLTIGGYNKISGNLSSIPSGMTQFNIRGVSPGSDDTLGGNTITGNLSSISSLPLTLFVLQGNNNITGNTSNFPSTLVEINVSNSVLQRFVISGNLVDLPTSLRLLKLIGGSLNSTLTYSGNRTWEPNMGYFQITISSAAPPISGIGDLIISLASTTWIGPTINNPNPIILRGSNPGTLAVDSALLSLELQGITVQFF